VRMGGMAPQEQGWQPPTTTPRPTTTPQHMGQQMQQEAPWQQGATLQYLPQHTGQEAPRQQEATPQHMAPLQSPPQHVHAVYRATAPQRQALSALARLPSAATARAVEAAADPKDSSDEDSSPVHHPHQASTPWPILPAPQKATPHAMPGHLTGPVPNSSRCCRLRSGRCRGRRRGRR
jgi:hypothetical protein